MKNIFSRFTIVLCLLVVCIDLAYAVPAYRGWVTKTQPDGTEITVRQIGDEFYHYWETEDGRIAVEQADGRFVVTNEDIPTHQQAARRREASSMYPSKPRRAIGGRNFAPRGLVILVQFQGTSFNSANDKTAHENMLNQEGYSYNGATGSAVEYFKAQSNNQYAPVFDVVGPVTLPNNVAYYGEQGYSSTTQSTENDLYIADFVIDAILAADELGCDFSKYDGDNDGKVDIVYLIYAGKGQADGGSTSTIWPHNWELQSALAYGQTHGTSGYYVNVNSSWYITSMNMPKLDGKTINNYACSAELNGKGARSGIGTLCHEFSHVLGLPDYYVTSSTAANEGKNYTPGAWTLMDYGSYNNSGKTPPNYSIFDKYYMGWATPTFLAKNEAANGVLTTTTYGDAYQIDGTTTGLKAYTNTSKIWYLENRQKTGWDAYLPGHGMCVWEVKYNSSNWTSNEPNNDVVGYTIVTANSLSTPYTPYVTSTTASSTSGTPFPGTGKVKSYTPATGCALTNITESDGVITFKYNGGIDCHNISANGTGCAIAPSTSCVENGNGFTATITPTDDTYDYTSLSVTRGSTTLTSGTHYTLSTDKKTLTVKAAAVTGSSSDAFTITAVWTKARCAYEMLGESCTAELSGTVNLNGALNLTITPSSGYTLADAECWDVTMGGTQLTYGTGFTYNSSTNTFSISKVTGDVEIMAYGLRPVTWNANGSVHATNVAVDGKITLPDAPGDCESGKVFVGWCTSSSYSHATTAPTFAKTGDTYSVANYYAVYATASGSGSNSSATYSFSDKSWGADQGNWTSGKDGGNYQNNGVQVTTTYTGANATCPTSYSGVTSIVVSYCTNASKGAGTIEMEVNGTKVSQTVSTSGGTTARNLTFDFSSTKPSGTPKITVNCTTNSIYVCGVTINYSSASYSDYSTACGAACTNTPSMSFANTTVNKTTADASYTQAVTITGKGSGQAVAYSSSDETIATVDASGKVTLKGKIGSTTITASVAANGTYCSASASYTLNVTAAPINVTLYYGGTSATLSNQTNPYTLPTTGTYVADMCDGDWTFDGWYNSAYDKSTTKPTYITQLTATGSAYAVYKTTETTSAGVSPRKAETSSGSVTITKNTSNIPTAYGTANTFTEYTLEGYKFKIQQMYLNSGKLQWRASGNASGTGTMYNTQTFPGKLSSIVLTYNSSDANKNFTLNVGATQNPTSGTSITPTSSDNVYTFDCSSANADYFVLTNGTGAGYLDQIVINYGSSSGGGTTSTTYYATTPECETQVVCALTGITLNTSNVKTAFTNEESFSYNGLVVTAAYSNCDSKTVTPTNVSTPNMTTAGQKTVTVTYAEGGVTKTATYQITVTAVVYHTVTWKSCGETVKTEQVKDGAALVLPTAPGANAGKTFAGWTATQHHTGASAPADLFTTAGTKTVTADVTYYAVFK